MNYSGLVATTLKKLNHQGLAQQGVEEILQIAFKTLEESLVSYGRVNIRNFGTFETKWIESRKGRMVRTGKIETLPGYWKIRFRPARQLKAKVQVVKDLETVRVRTETNDYLGGLV